MSADGVEVAQQHDVPFVVAHVQVGEYLLEHALGLPVGVRGRVLGAAFGDGDELRLAIDRGAGREHQVLAAMAARHVAQRQRAGHVVPVVLERLLHAFAHGLEPGEVDDDIHRMTLEHLLQRLGIQDALLVEGQAAALAVGLGAGEGAHALERFLAGIAQVVDHHHVVAAVEQLHHRMAADESGATRDQDRGLVGRLVQCAIAHGRTFRECGGPGAPMRRKAFRVGITSICRHCSSIARCL